MFDRPQRNAFRAPDITHRNVVATVKWFNPSKGFGFVTPDDGSADAFLHGTVLQFTGHATLPEGATIECDLARGPKGPQVAVIHSVDTSTAAPPRPSRRPGPGAGPGGPASSSYAGGEVVEGKVKWFNVTRGFGFVAPQGGGQDIFVHSRALQRSGLDGIADGEQVRVTVRQGMKGPEAERIEILSSVA